MVVRAPIEEVSKKFKTRPAVAKYVQSVKAVRMKQDVAIQQIEEIREAFLLQMRDTPEWSVLLQTIHWFHSCDAIMVTALASAYPKNFRRSRRPPGTTISQAPH